MYEAIEPEKFIGDAAKYPMEGTMV